MSDCCNHNYIGVPVAWAILDKEEVSTLQEFFKCVQGRVPEALISTLMTDDGKNYSSFIARLFHQKL